MSVSLITDVLMPRDLDHDGQVCWWSLAAIARHNGNAPQRCWKVITTAEVWTWGDEDWQQLADDTPEIFGLISEAQRARIAALLFDLERADLEEPDDWWDR